MQDYLYLLFHVTTKLCTHLTFIFTDIIMSPAETLTLIYLYLYKYKNKIKISNKE